MTLAAAVCSGPGRGRLRGPPAEKSAAGGSAESGHAKDPGSADEKGKKPSWWRRLSKYHREPKEKPWVYGDVRPGKGLLGGDEHGFVLLRKGEGETSSGPQQAHQGQALTPDRGPVRAGVAS